MLKHRKRIMLSLPLDLIPKVQARANEENRPVTNYIETLIKKDLGETVTTKKQRDILKLSNVKTLCELK